MAPVDMGKFHGILGPVLGQPGLSSVHLLSKNVKSLPDRAKCLQWLVNKQDLVHPSGVPKSPEMHFKVNWHLVSQAKTEQQPKTCAIAPYSFSRPQAIHVPMR